MKKKGKALKIFLGAILLLAGIFISYYLIHYYFYDEYKDFLTDYVVEEGTEFVPIQETRPDVEGMVLVSESDSLKLYTNTDTAEIAVYDKRNGEITYSNPQDADNDSIASSTNKNYLKSQIILEYFNENRALNTYDSYSMAVEKGQILIESIENGIRYTYEMGDKSSATGIVPVYIQQAVLDDVLSKLDETGYKFVKGKYKTSEVGEGFLELLEASRSGASTLRKLNAYFEEAGFTEEMYNEQMMASGVEGAVPLTLSIAIEYRLDGDGLNVSVPMSSVKEVGGGKIYRIQVLRYMGAASMDEEGYMVVPNGSGSLINFNNEKNNVPNYIQYIYGIDKLSADYTVLENSEEARMPLFGICRNDSSLLVTIEDGVSLCYLTANVSGNLSSYNTVYPTFTVRGFDKLSMFGTTGNEADVPVVESDYYDVNFEVKYAFLTEENKGYEGIANYYRNRLIDEGVLSVHEEAQGDIPFYYDVIGGVKETASFLGKQYLSVNPLTTFEEAGEMATYFDENGIDHQVMNFQGWFNGGFYHDVADKIHVLWQLGGKNALEELSNTISEIGGRFYGDVAFQKVTFISKRFSYTNESSHYYGAGYVATFGEVNPANLRQTASLSYNEIMYNLISPKFLVRYVDNFSDKISDYDIMGISLRDLGNTLYSDKKRTEMINREEALDIVEGQLNTLYGTGKDLMVNGVNAYALPYVTDIINMPTEDNNFYIIDEEIPLYQMIIHGSVDYGCDPINLGDTLDSQDTVLRLIATGSSPHFVFSYDGSNDLKYTGLLAYYSTNFSYLKDVAIDIYKEVNDSLKYVSGATMVGHDTAETGITKTTYSNGVMIYVNRTDHDYTMDDIIIPAMSYVMKGVQ